MKKKSDITIFFWGWIASATAVLIPTVLLVFIKRLYPDFFNSSSDKISVILYLVGAFFSGLFTIWRVQLKAAEKEVEIEDINKQIEVLSDEIEEYKKAYYSISPKTRIIDLLCDLHVKAKDCSGKKEILELFMSRIGEINKDSTFDPNHLGGIDIPDDDFKKPKTTKSQHKKASVNSPDDTYLNEGWAHFIKSKIM